MSAMPYLSTQIRVMRLGLTLIAATASCLLAQSGAPAFDVASVKPEPWTGQGGMYTVVRGNTLTAEHEDLFDLVKFAYSLNRDMQLSGGPGWATHRMLDESDLYQVIAKAGGDAPPDENQMRRMLQTLLAERFQLKVHRVSKDLPVYNLVVAKNGPRLKESAPDAEFALNIRSGVPTRMNGIHVPLAKAIPYIEHAAGLPVIDKTGLTGLYDLELEWAGEPTDAVSPSIFTAVQDKLGLKLEKATAPFNTVVIDHAEKPSAN